MHAAPLLLRRTAIGLMWLPAVAAQAGGAATVPASPAAIQAVLDELDAAFGRGDQKVLAARFAPEFPSAHEALQQRLAMTIATTTSRQRQSTLVGAPRGIGCYTVAAVRHALHLQGGPHATLPSSSFTEDYVWVLRLDAAGRLVPTLAVETVPGGGVPGDCFRCPACNFQIGDAPGWLCVPRRGDRAAALEAASFYLLGSDVVCDVSVQVDPDCHPAAMVAQQLADTLQQLQPGAMPGVPDAWLPPAHAAAAPSGLQGARVVIDLPADAGRAAARAIFHVVAFGGLQHLLLLNGSTASLQASAIAIDALLASYRLLECDRDLARAAAEPLEHHTGGVLTGGTYENRQFGVDLAGAAGWRPAMLTGGPAFRVVWTSPNESRLWLTGYLVPPGMSRWCQTTAGRWLEQQCAQRGVELLPDDAASTAWKDEGGCGWTRTLAGRPQKPETADAPRRRWFRLLVRDDLLLVVDGFATNDADEASLQQMLQTLRRR